MTDTDTTQTQTPAAPRYRYVIYSLVVLMNLMLGIAFLAPASVLPLITDAYDLNRSEGGFVVTSITLVFTALTIPAAIIVARWNIRFVFGIGWALLGITAFTPFLSDLPFLSSFWWFIVLRSVQGIGAAAVTPLTAGILMRWAPPGEVPNVNAVALASITVGLGIAQYLGPVLADWTSWEWALGIEGVIAAAGAVLFVILWREREAIGGAPPDPVKIGAILSVFKRRETWLMSFAVVGPWAQFITLNTWLPTFYEEERGLSLAMAGAMAGVFSLAGAPANIVGGAIATITGKRRPILIWSGLLVGAAGVTTIYAPVGIMLISTVVIAGFLHWIYEPTLFTIPIELPGSSPERAGAIWAAILTAGNGSSFFAPILAGFIIDETGSFLFGIALVCATSFTLFIAGILLPETGPGRLNTPQGART